MPEAEAHSSQPISNQQTQNQDRDPNRPPSQEGTEETNSEHSQSGHQKRNGKDSRSQDTPWFKAHVIATGFLTAVLIFATWLNAHYVGKQWGAMERTLRITQEAVLVPMVGGPNNVQEGDNTFQIGLRNIGKTQATRVSPLVLDHTLAVIKTVPTFERPPDESQHRFITVIPDPISPPSAGPTVSFSLPVHLGHADIEKINFKDEEGRSILYIRGVIRYWNGFSCKRLTICRQYVPQWQAACDVGPVATPPPGAVLIKSLRECEADIEKVTDTKKEDCEG